MTGVEADQDQPQGLLVVQGVAIVVLPIQAVRLEVHHIQSALQDPRNNIVDQSIADHPQELL